MSKYQESLNPGIVNTVSNKIVVEIVRQTEKLEGQYVNTIKLDINVLNVKS